MDHTVSAGHLQWYLPVPSPSHAHLRWSFLLMFVSVGLTCVHSWVFTVWVCLSATAYLVLRSTVAFIWRQKERPWHLRPLHMVIVLFQPHASPRSLTLSVTASCVHLCKYKILRDLWEWEAREGSSVSPGCEIRGIVSGSQSDRSQSSVHFLHTECEVTDMFL